MRSTPSHMLIYLNAWSPIDGNVLGRVIKSSFVGRSVSLEVSIEDLKSLGQSQSFLLSHV